MPKGINTHTNKSLENRFRKQISFDAKRIPELRQYWCNILSTKDAENASETCLGNSCAQILTWFTESSPLPTPPGPLMLRLFEKNVTNVRKKQGLSNRFSDTLFRYSLLILNYAFDSPCFLHMGVGILLKSYLFNNHPNIIKTLSKHYPTVTNTSPEHHTSLINDKQYMKQ